MKDVESVLIARVHSLERRLRVLSLLFGISFVAVTLMAATPEPSSKVIEEDVLVVRTLVAQEILLGSTAGAEGPAIRIAADPEPRVQLFSADKKTRASLALLKDQAALFLQAPDGDQSVAVMVGPDESEMVFFRGQQRAIRVATSPFGGMVGIFDAAGDARGGVGMTGDGPFNGVR